MFRYSGDPILSVDRRTISATFDRAEIRFLDLTPPATSFELRLLIGDEGRYLASQFFYGVGPVDTRSDPQQTAPVDVRLNVTVGLRAFLLADKSETIVVRGVAVSRDGTEISEPELRFRDALLVAMAPRS